MDIMIDIVVQFGALGLLGYLIVWLTRTGGPALFAQLDGIRLAIQQNSDRIERLEESHLELVKALKKAE